MVAGGLRASNAAASDPAIWQLELNSREPEFNLGKADILIFKALV